MGTKKHLSVFILIVVVATIAIFLLSDYDWSFLEYEQGVTLGEISSKRIIDDDTAQIKEEHSSTERFSSSVHF